MREVEHHKFVGHKHEHVPVNLDVSGPIFFWAGVVLLAAVIQLLIIPVLTQGIVSPAVSMLNIIATYLLYIPGVFVIPMITALWIGNKVGATLGDYSTITYRALLNALYACVVYVIEMFMIFIIAISAHTGILASIGLNQFLEFVIVMPVLISVIVVPLFALVSTAKRY